MTMNHDIPKRLSTFLKPAKKRYLSIEKLSEVLKAVDDGKESHIISTLMLYSGMRLGEIMKVETDNSMDNH